MESPPTFQLFIKTLLRFSVIGISVIYIGMIAFAPLNVMQEIHMPYEMSERIALIALSVVGLCGYLCMLRSRRKLFERVAGYKKKWVKTEAHRFHDYLEKHHPGIALDSIEEVAPIIENVLKLPFEYLKIEPTDREVAVLAAGSFMGELLREGKSARWIDINENGPALVIEEGEDVVTLYPVKKAALYHEFGRKGELIVYLTTDQTIQELHKSPKAAEQWSAPNP